MKVGVSLDEEKVYRRYAIFSYGEVGSGFELEKVEEGVVAPVEAFSLQGLDSSMTAFDFSTSSSIVESLPEIDTTGC